MQDHGLLGWPTRCALEHDLRAPALIRRILSARPACRQAIFAALAFENMEGVSPAKEGPERSVGRSTLLRDGSANEIIEHAYGNCPEGFLGVLARIGPRPFRTPRAYVELHRLFSEPAEKHRALALRHVGTITESTIQIITMLRFPYATHAVVSRLSHVGEALAFMTAVGGVQQINTKATDVAILEAISALRPETGLNTLIDRLVKRADVLPPGPIPDDHEVRGLRSAPDLIATGRRYRNCLTTKLKSVLGGRSAFIEFRREAIVEFVRLSTGSFLYVGCHTYRNGPVSDEVEQAAQDKAAANGIPHVLLPSCWDGFGACGSLLPGRDDLLPELAA